MDEKTCREIISWLTLIRAPSLPYGVALQLLERFQHPDKLISADSNLLISNGLDKKTIRYFHCPDKTQLEIDLKWLDEVNHHFIHILHPQYPDLLKQIPDPPLALFARGDSECLSKYSIAVIGSRKPTPGGKKIADDFAKELSDCGIIVSSGLAYGIDTSAHLGALKGETGTIAVLGGGINRIYPRTNLNLAEKIAERGLLISEFPLNTPPLPYHFPRRNRIISGLSLGVLVVEASLKSGSLITANLAVEQGREVFAIPGSILNPTSDGCNKLISTGAKLTANIQDMIEEIPCLNSLIIKYEETKRTSQVNNETLDEQVKLLLDNIGYEPASFEGIVAGSGLSIERIRVLLPELELDGLIQVTAGGRYVKK
ncbi:MAG: DNA-protecting protein DprA [Gammaproteobacteria bacterium]|nr:DNA-protecting protein DprA [Gammaproteobacteria bacterium]